VIPRKEKIMTHTEENISSKEASAEAVVEEEEMEVVTSKDLEEVEDSIHTSIWEWLMTYLETSLEVKIHLLISLTMMMISLEGHSQ